MPERGRPKAPLTLTADERDEPRPGAPRTIGDEMVEEVIVTTLEKRC